MIKRYSISEIENIWNDENKLNKWWEVEFAVLSALNDLKIIPYKDLQLIKNSTKISLTRMLEIELETKHDVVAFTRMISESLGNEARWIHLGITSTDIVDTAQNLMIKESSKIFSREISKLNKTILKLSKENKNTLIMGRSHGIYGEPTSLGLKFLLWYSEISRQIARINQAFNDVCVTKISGSMGNFANTDIEVENLVAKKLKMPVDLLSTQVSQRDRIASLILCFANLSSTFEKIATEIRLYQRSEVQEMFEGFSKNQKGSSSMPHKKNPISSENITGLSRIIKSYIIPALENNVLWHERDISHSSNERIILPNVFNLAVYITRRLNLTLTELVIDKNQMLKNINSANNIFYSQPILTFILKNKSFTREEVYDFIQGISNISLENKKDFVQCLKENGIEKYLSFDELEKICQLKYFLRNVDKIFERVLKNQNK